MKILLINDKGFKSGGSQEYLFYLKKELVKRGHIVKIVSSDLNSNDEYFCDYMFKSVSSRNIFRGFLRLFNFNAFFSIKKLIKEFKPDVVHLNYIFNQVSPAVFLLLKNRTSVMTIHDEVMIQGRISKDIKYPTIVHYIFEKIRGAIYYRLLKNVDYLVAPSEHIKKIYKDQGFRNISTISNGVVLGEGSEQKFNNKILFVGRLEREKGLEYLLRSLSLILRVIPTATLDIVGDGGLKQELNLLVKELKIEKYVSFFGKLSHDMVGDHFRECEIVVLPSIEESFGLVGIEAMNFGRPVIASNVGGIPDWLDDNVEGFLVESRNAEQLAEKIKLLLNNKELVIKFSNNAKIKSAQFDINKQVDKLVNLYSGTLK